MPKPESETNHALAGGQYPDRRRSCRQTVWVPGICRHGAGQPRIAAARDVPLGLRDRTVLDAQPSCHDCELAVFVDDAVVGGLAAHGVDITALHLSQRSHALPDAFARRNVEGVFRVAIPDRQGRSRSIVPHDREQVLVERRLQARAVTAARPIAARCAQWNE